METVDMAAQIPFVKFAKKALKKSEFSGLFYQLNLLYSELIC